MCRIYDSDCDDEQDDDERDDDADQHHHDIFEQMIAYMKVPAEDAGYMIVVMNW